MAKNIILRMLFPAVIACLCPPFGGSIAAAAAGHAAGAWDESALVMTAYGDVQGFDDSFDTWVWKAIPYAKPPVGALRWKAPQDPDPWTGTRLATDFCSWCPQYSSASGDNATDNETGTIVVGSEDCLYLNIWRPRSAAQDLPVFVWIHGGSNVQGSADPYNGAALAGRHNLVVVTINYRLGPLGWFTHPALRDGTGELDGSGNFGTLDTIKALEWVRDCIGAFGGDAQNVTVAGQSAGGVNVFSLMISPLAAGLFHRAISLSGELDPVPQAEGDAYADEVIEALLVADGTPPEDAAAQRESMSFAAIRTYLWSKSAEQLFRAIAGLSRNPAVFADGAVVNAQGAEALDDPDSYNQVPVIIGSTSEEGKLFMYAFGLYKTWNSLLYQSFGKGASRLARKTGLDPLARKMSAHASQPGVYCSIFTYGQYRRFGYNAWPTDAGPTDSMSWAVALGAMHALDIPFYFDLFESYSLFDVTSLIFREDNRPGWQSLSDAMMAYTAQFARSGNPNTAGLPEWTEWSNRIAAPRFILFDADDSQALIRMAAEVP